MKGHAERVARFVVTGKAAEAAHAAVKEAFAAGLRGRDPAAYDRLLAAFRQATSLALPGDESDLCGRIDGGEKAAIETAVAFLDADPWFFRSGYLKEKLIRRIKRANLSAAQREILARLVLRIVQGRDRREFPEYCRLALAIATPDLRRSLEIKALDPDPGVRRRARWILMRFHPGRCWADDGPQPP